MRLEKNNSDEKWEKFEANTVKVLELSQHLQIENNILRKKETESKREKQLLEGMVQEIQEKYVSWNFEGI